MHCGIKIQQTRRLWEIKQVKVGHHTGGGLIDYSVQVTCPGDRVMEGLEDFDMYSEQYYMHVDPNVKVLVAKTFNGDHAPWIDGAVMPVVWKKHYGDGRVFYNSPGHVAADFEVPEALEIMKRGIRWASESKATQPNPGWNRCMNNLSV